MTAASSNINQLKAGEVVGVGLAMTQSSCKIGDNRGWFVNALKWLLEPRINNNYTRRSLVFNCRA